MNGPAQDIRAGDGSFAGSTRLYLERGLRLSLLERLRAVEAMGDLATLLQQAPTPAATDEGPAKPIDTGVR